MQVALVQNGQNHVHDKDCEEHQDGEARYRVSERKRLAPELAANSWWQDSLRSLLDEISGLPDGIAGLQVEDRRGVGEWVAGMTERWAKIRRPARRAVRGNQGRAVAALVDRQMKSR